YNWRHIYSCYKKNQSGFVELCFLCSQWTSAEAQWSKHCQAHLDSETLPLQCNPLVHRGILATAGYCVFYMANPLLLPEQ
ncbi:hypothetical protein B0T25DRAFT_445302, partial [Lasiosphaeria hispida]